MKHIETIKSNIWQTYIRWKFKGALPSKVKKTMSDIENALAKNIQFEIISKESTDSMACMCNYRIVSIQLPGRTDFNVQAAHHELLHLYRYIVEGVPALGENGPSKERTADIDNLLEHLVIVPRQRNAMLGTYDSSFWDKAACDVWDNYFTDDYKDGMFDKHQWSRIAGLSAMLAESRDAKLYCQKKIREAGKEQEILQFQKQVKSLESDKIALTRYVWSELGLPIDGLLLQTYNIKTRNFQITNIDGQPV